VPTDQVDLATTITRTEIAGDHDVSLPFLSATAGTQAVWPFIRRQCLDRHSVEDAYGGMSEASGEHVARVWILVVKASGWL
jgi:hypothetical protein